MFSRGLASLALLACCVLSCSLSFLLVWNHRRSWSQPIIQRKVVSILWMVPIYSVESWVSLRIARPWPFLDMLRDCYEAYVVYTFFALCVAYIGVDRTTYASVDASKVRLVLQESGSVAHPPPFDRCLNRVNLLTGSQRFILKCKLCILQFVIVKPLCTLAAVILSFFGLYTEGEINFTQGYVYLALIDNVSVSFSLYYLVLFYMATKTALAPYSPLPKFLCVKFIIFFSWWQGVILAVLCWLGVLRGTSEDRQDQRPEPLFVEPKTDFAKLGMPPPPMPRSKPESLAALAELTKRIAEAKPQVSCGQSWSPNVRTSDPAFMMPSGHYTQYPAAQKGSDPELDPPAKIAEPAAMAEPWAVCAKSPVAVLAPPGGLQARLHGRESEPAFVEVTTVQPSPPKTRPASEELFGACSRLLTKPSSMVPEPAFVEVAPALEPPVAHLDQKSKLSLSEWLSPQSPSAGAPAAPASPAAAAANRSAKGAGRGKSKPLPPGKLTRASLSGEQGAAMERAAELRAYATAAEQKAAAFAQEAALLRTRAETAELELWLAATAGATPSQPKPVHIEAVVAGSGGGARAKCMEKAPGGRSGRR